MRLHLKSIWRHARWGWGVWRVRWVLALGAPALAAVGAEAGLEFTVTLPPSELVQKKEALLKLASVVAKYVEIELPNVGGETGREKLLLGMRVHSALLLGDEPKALDAADRIKKLQTSAADRAVAGLLTDTVVFARRAIRDGGGARDLSRVFAERFRAHLRSLPRTPEVTAVLKLQRQRTAELDRAALVAEARRVQLLPGGKCTVEQADQLIRIGHKLSTLLPLRDTTLNVLDEVLAERGRE